MWALVTLRDAELDVIALLENLAGISDSRGVYEHVFAPVVRRDESAEKTAGGIVLPESAKSKPQRGKVLAAGPGRLLKDGTRRSL